MTETRPPNCSDVTDWGEVKCKWINVLVCVLAVPTKKHKRFLRFSPSALGHIGGAGGGNGGWRGRSLSWSPVAVFPETGSNAGQATLNSSAGFIVSEVDRVRPCSSSSSSSSTPPLPPQHEDSVSIGHGADTGSTDKSLSRSLRRTLLGSEVTC